MASSLVYSGETTNKTTRQVIYFTVVQKGGEGGERMGDGLNLMKKAVMSKKTGGKEDVYSHEKKKKQKQRKGGKAFS